MMTYYSKFQPLLTSSFSEIGTTKKEYMYRKKIVICKYHLKDKCKFGSKCNFVHIQMKEIEQNLEEVIKLRSENASLKTEFYKMVQENRKLKLNESTNVSTKAYRVLALQKGKEKNYEEKVTYSSLFKKKSLSQKVELDSKKACANKFASPVNENVSVCRKSSSSLHKECQITKANHIKVEKSSTNINKNVITPQRPKYDIKKELEKINKRNKEQDIYIKSNDLVNINENLSNVEKKLEKKILREKYMNNERMKKIQKMEKQLDDYALSLEAVENQLSKVTSILNRTLQMVAIERGYQV